MAKKTRIERLVRKLMSEGGSPRLDLVHALGTYEKETGEPAPASLDYLTGEGSARTSRFTAWYEEKKAAIFEELERLRKKEPRELGGVTRLMPGSKVVVVKEGGGS